MRSSSQKPRTENGGFTLIEVVVVVAVIALLAGLVVPTVVGVSDDAKASKIMAVYDATKKACERYYTHTSTTAREYSNSTRGNRHELSLTQTTPNWSGPYLDHPLTTADNPFNGHILVYESFTQGGANAPGGFDLLGSGTNSATGNGQYIMFYNVPQETAKAVNDSLDSGIGGNWMATGRVEYIANRRRLNIFMLDTP